MRATMVAKCRLTNLFLPTLVLLYRAQTESDGSALPNDLLLKKLIDLFNMDNPPCANCDKRDRTSMFFCATCSKSFNFLYSHLS